MTPDDYVELTHGDLVSDILRLLSCLEPSSVKAWKCPTGFFKADGRAVKFGLTKGGSDLILAKRRVITRKDFGHPIAQFGAIEVKRPNDELTDKQRHFLQVISDHGGIAGVARCPADAIRLIGALGLIGEYE